MKIVSQQKISLKGHSHINEKAIQDYIFDNPEILGLGDLQPIVKEKIQPQGGRLDMLFGDDDNNRYEVELMLGATDPSHIIRTLEYWDTERKRYPQYDHTAVIVAEDITSRFQNVISLFNSQIPLIALQLSATMTDDGNIAISFIKVMDKVDLGSDEEEYVEPTDRAYWEKKSTKAMLNLTDKLFEELGELKEGYELKYNKFYVGLAKNGVARNFISFVPKKSFVTLRVHSEQMPEIDERLEQAGLDIGYNKRRSRYYLKLKKIEELRNNRDDILALVDSAKSKLGAE
ncbi:hypothetical protein QYZ88_014105 [Lachnospiraceae bacterium C1.1]|nr:hypothetical protein [Lachnospiraceae bacterium C1.1]